MVVNFILNIFQLVRRIFFLLTRFTNYLVHYFLSITCTSDFSWRQRSRISNFKHISKKIFDPVIARIRQRRLYIIIKTSPTRVSIHPCNLWLIIERQITGVYASMENQLESSMKLKQKAFFVFFSLSLSRALVFLFLFGRNSIQFK